MKHSLEQFLLLADTLNTPSDIVKLLEFLANAVDADGVIYWRLAPGSYLQEGERKGRFFPVASWCRFEDVRPWYFLPVESITGDAWLERTSKPYRIVPSIEAESRIPEPARKKLIERWKVTSCASIPLASEGRPPSSVTFYKRGGEIGPEKLDKVVPLTRQLPTLYALSGDRQALHFLSRLNGIIHPSRELTGPTTLAAARERLNMASKLIAEYFDAIETSILLVEKMGQASPYRVQAFQWGWPNSEPFQEAVPGIGLTGWVLENRIPIRILDLLRYSEDSLWLQSIYPGLQWKDRLVIRQRVRDKFRMPEEKEDFDLPIASYVCVPVVHGRLLGAIRCCGRERSPWAFEDRDLRMLELAAAFVGGWWEDWLEFSELQAEIDREKELAKSVSRLHRAAAKTLTDERKDFDSLLEATVDAAMAAIPAVNHGSIRLIDETQNELYYRTTRGPHWSKGNERKVAERLNMRFPLENDSVRSSGAYVVKSDSAYIVNDPERDEWDMTILPEVKRRLYAPIRSSGKVLGVLGLGRTVEQDFTEREAIAAEMIAAQVGLYIHLEKQLEGRVLAQRKLLRAQEEQTRTFEDLRHQIYGPAGTAAMTIARIIETAVLSPDVKRALMIARGDALRTSIMVRNLELFAALASGRSPRVNSERLTSNWLRERLQELAEHQHSLTSAKKNLEFLVLTSGIEFLDGNPVYCDINLLEHAISNLLENARKYSGKGSKVTVHCGSMDRNRLFFISVQNSGLRIEGGDVGKMIGRGWRSEEAWKVVGEGEGIGLYVVSEIMKAHRGGRLQISPTSSTNVNDFRLLFTVGMNQ